MVTAILLMFVLNIFIVLGLVVIWQKLKRPPQDDPRLSRGLQLLQSKINIMEDLSDRTDTQVRQLLLLIDQKGQQLQKKIQESEVQLIKVGQSMQKSKDVAKIFQDKIPHHEIIERQNSLNYIKASKMAHAGSSIEEIETELGIPQSEIEFITKVNKQDLIFEESELPEWAKESAESKNISDEEIISGAVSEFSLKDEEFKNMETIGQEFKKACRSFEDKQKELDEEKNILEVAKAKSVATGKIISEQANTVKVHVGDLSQVAAKKAINISEQAAEKAKTITEQAAVGAKVATNKAISVAEKATEKAFDVGEKVAKKAVSATEQATEIIKSSSKQITQISQAEFKKQLKKPKVREITEIKEKAPKNDNRFAIEKKKSLEQNSFVVTKNIGIEPVEFPNVDITKNLS